MGDNCVFDLGQDKFGVTIELMRNGEIRNEWVLILRGPFSTTTRILDRKNMKDLIEALEGERYGTAKSVDV